MVTTHLALFSFFNGMGTAAAPAPVSVPSGGTGAGTPQRFSSGRERRGGHSKSSGVPVRDYREPIKQSDKPADRAPDVQDVIEARAEGVKRAELLAARAAEIARIKTAMRLERDTEAINVMESQIAAIEQHMKSIRDAEEFMLLMVLH